VQGSATFQKLSVSESTVQVGGDLTDFFETMDPNGMITPCAVVSSRVSVGGDLRCKGLHITQNSSVAVSASLYVTPKLELSDSQLHAMRFLPLDNPLPLSSCVFSGSQFTTAASGSDLWCSSLYILSGSSVHLLTSLTIDSALVLQQSS